MIHQSKIKRIGVVWSIALTLACSGCKDDATGQASPASKASEATEASPPVSQNRVQDSQPSR